MPFINIPSYGSASWKDPVADPASLPASGNELGDARVTESTSEIYVWDGSAWQNVGGSASAITALTNDVTATGPGSVAATVAFVGGETAADVATSVQDTQAATDLSTISTIVKRDGSGETSLDGLNLDGLTSGAINLKAADTTTSYTVKMPPAQGGAGTFLENDGSGNLSWGSAASYPAFSDDQVLYSTTSGVEWRTVGTGSTTAAYPADTVIVGRAKPASLTGINNTLICSGAGSALQGNTNITAIGKDALLSMTGTAGNFYVAIGNEALKSVTTISDATAHGAVAIGYQALVNATDIRKVTAIGYQASRASGERNTVIGWQARFNSTGSFNVIIGDTAGSAGTVSQTVLIGTNCNLTGTGNIAIGESAGASGAGTGTILIGAGTTVSGSTTGGIALGRSCQVASNEFAVGSASYQINTMLLGRGGASQTVANAVKIQTMRGTGTDRDMSVGTLTIAGAQGTGTGPGGDVIIATAAPSLSSGSTLNNHVEVMRITDTGLVGIQTSTPNDPLTVQGSINYTTGSQDYKISPAHHDHGTETTNFTINWSTSPVQTVTLNGTTNAVVTLQNAVQGGAYVLRVIQGATPGTIDFTAGDFADAVWPGGTPPTLSSTTGDVDLINLLYIDDGGGTVTYYGTFAADFS